MLSAVPQPPLAHLYDVWRTLAAKDFKVRYKRSVLGYAWSVLNPLAFTAVLFVAFRIVMKVQVEHFALYLASGLFAWQTFNNSVVVGSSIFVSNASLLKKVCFPRWILVGAYLSSELLHLALAIPVLIALVCIYQHPVDWVVIVWATPLLMLSQAVLCLGPALITATTNVFFRDLERIASVGMNILFYTTPIIYTAEMIKPVAGLMHWHPVACQVMAFRAVFYDGRMAWDWYLCGLATSMGMLLVGAWVYRVGIKRVPEAI